MLSFHNDPKIKEFYLNRVREHAKADEIVKGQYWQRGKGCAVGCTIHSSNHNNYESELGIPMALARLEDSIFEGLPNEEAKLWPEKFLEAIPVGKDLSKVWYRFAIFLLIDPTQCNSKHPQCMAVAGNYMRLLGGESVDWQRVRADADDAAAYATHAAAYAADDAADAAALVADNREKARIAQAEKLLELLKSVE